MSGQSRLLHGGSRFSKGERSVHSAHRLHSSPDRRNLNAGLRLAGGYDPLAGKQQTLNRRKEAQRHLVNVCDGGF